VLLLNVIEILSRRLKESMSLVGSLALFEIPQRLAAFLLQTLQAGQSRLPTDRLSITHRNWPK
jgi:hypothetical protein